MIFEFVVELATYTSAFATYAIKILTGNTLNTRGHSTRQHYVTISTPPSQQDYPTTQIETKPSFTISTSPSQQDYPIILLKLNLHLPVTISTPPSQQDYPTTQIETKPSFTISTSPSQQDYPTTQTETKPSLTISTITFAIRLSNITTQSTPTHSPTNSTSRRRQFRVHRGRTQNVLDGARSANRGTSCICTNPTH
ncbi:unnamed protein product [Rhizophagus irregularis]|nr:unnamed protein product [Rhizophagus irregularis]